MKYEITRDWIYLDIDKETAAKFNAVHTKKGWRIPNTLGALRELRDVLRLTPITEGQPYPKWQEMDLEDVIRARETHRRALIRFKTINGIPGDERLRPYQKTDVYYLSKLPHAAIFNEQRTGKTPTSLCLLAEKGVTSGLIVCPAGLCLQWKEEIEKWLHGAKATVLTGKTKKKRLALIGEQDGFLVVSYETLKNDLEHLMKNDYEVVLLDEAHRLRSVTKGRNGVSQQAEACFSIGRKAKMRVALTGTPAVREAYEIFGILKFLYPERFPSFWQFVDRYFEVKKDFMGYYKIGKPKRQEELEDVIGLISVNRKRRDIMSWLPRKSYQTVKLEMSPRQAKAYKDISETFEYEENGDILIDAPSILAQLTRLRQITTDPRVLEIDDKGAKEKFILEWLKDNPNEPVIIFSQFTSALARLKKEIDKTHNSVVISGEQNMELRRQYQRWFQEGEINIILANIQAAKEGLTLDRAETTIFLDKSYLPSDNAQASDRMVPVSEERNHAMTVISLVCKDTIDENIEYLLKKRLNLIEIVNSGGLAALRRSLNNEI